MPVKEEQKEDFGYIEQTGEDPHISIFGKKANSPCNINTYYALQKFKIMKNGQVYYPFLFDKTMFFNSNRVSF